MCQFQNVSIETKMALGGNGFSYGGMDPFGTVEVVKFDADDKNEENFSNHTIYTSFSIP